MKRIAFAVPLLAAASLLSGCAIPGIAPLQDETRALRDARSSVRIEPAPKPATTVQGLDADAAVRLALRGNPGVRASLAQLQLSQADLYDALRPSNPSLGFTHLTADGIVRNTWSLSQPLLDLLFVNYRRQHGLLAMREAQQRVADQLLRLERDVRQAWLAHAAATLRLAIAQRAAEAAELAAELAHRYHEAGNISERQWRTEQSEAALAHLRASTRENELITARTALFDLLGVRQDSQIRFDPRLTLPGAFAPQVDALSEQALQDRLDLAAQRSALTLAQQQATQLRHWSWLYGTTVGFERERESGQQTLSGPGLTLELPFPNTGAGRRARGQALLSIREAELAQQQVHIRNSVARGVALLEIAARNLDQHTAPLLEANRRLMQTASEQHNYMLIGSFELLALRRRQIEGYEHWIDAIEQWWRACNELGYEAGGPLALPPAARQISVEDLP